jgi:hypothetical protein
MFTNGFSGFEFFEESDIEGIEYEGKYEGDEGKAQD